MYPYMKCPQSLYCSVSELAQACVPYQQYTASYPPEEALEKGTMFPELYRPYMPHAEKNMS